LFGLDRQVYYRSIKRHKSSQSKASKVIKLVEDIRVKMPKLGGRKLYFLLKEPLRSLKIGRDKFFDILRANHLLIIPKRSYIDKYDIETSLRRTIINEAIGIYNELRPYFLNHYLTPNQMHKQKEVKMKTYKSKNQSKNKFALV